MSAFFKKYKLPLSVAATVLVLAAAVLLCLRQCRAKEDAVSDDAPSGSVSAATTADAAPTTNGDAAPTTDAATVTTAATSAEASKPVSGAKTTAKKQVGTTAKRPATPPAPVGKTTRKPLAAFSPTLEYTVPQAALQYLGLRDISLYRRLVDAYMQYETVVPFTADDQPQTALELLYWYCPVFFADTALDENCIDWVYNEVHIRYTSKNRAEHEKIIKAFENRCLALLGNRTGETAQVAREVYRRFTKTLKYDTALLNKTMPRWDEPSYYTEKNPRYRETYTALMNGSGVCSSFAKAYAFLLLQCRVETMTIYCDHVSGLKDKAHEWTMMKLDGKWYFADPTWERNGSDTYFGVTTAEREQNGYLSRNFCLFFVYDTQFSEKFAVNDNRFMK